MMTDIDIMSKGMACLIRELGIVETETFIACLKNEKFDYTKWREDKFDDMTLSEIGQSASEYVSKHPFKGKATIL